jgi:Retrotransposon gag protein
MVLGGEKAPQRPHGDGDDPYHLDDLTAAADEGKDKYIRLEGVLPESYEGDWAETQNFLMQFKRYILMNWGVEIAKDPFKRCGLFLSLMKGPKVKGWVQRNYDWLDNAESDPETYVPHGMTAWQVLKREFHNTFIDYTEHERAQDELVKLKMQGGDVDGYITSFKFLSHRAGMDLNDPTALHLFARGLPRTLADACIDIDNLETFCQWANAAQRQQRNWMHKRAIHGEYGQTQPHTNQPAGNRFFWCCPAPGNAPRPQLPPHNPNAMDTSATARKAKTEAEKEKHHLKGRCYKCSKQGHVACNCPDKKTSVQARTADTQESKAMTPHKIAKILKAYGDDERDLFIKTMQDEGEELGFPTA